MTHVEVVRLLDEPDFRKCVSWWLMDTCQNVFNEDPGTSNHAARFELAQAINDNVDTYFERFAWRIILNSTIIAREDLGDILDNEGDIGFIISSVFNTYI